MSGSIISLWAGKVIHTKIDPLGAKSTQFLEESSTSKTQPHLFEVERAQIRNCQLHQFKLSRNTFVTRGEGREVHVVAKSLACSAGNGNSSIFKPLFLRKSIRISYGDVWLPGDVFGKTMFFVWLKHVANARQHGVNKRFKQQWKRETSELLQLGLEHRKF